MSASSNGKSGGIGFFGLLAIVFITLKLTNQIDWSWLWVLAPLWLPIALVVTIGVLFTGGVLIGRAFETPQKRHARRVKKAFGDYSDALTRRHR